MTKTFNRTGNGKTDHTQFGGLIYPSDFNTEYRRENNKNGSPIARRIENDAQFDSQCRKNRENLSRFLSLQNYYKEYASGKSIKNNLNEGR